MVLPFSLDKLWLLHRNFYIKFYHVTWSSSATLVSLVSQISSLWLYVMFSGNWWQILWVSSPSHKEQRLCAAWVGGLQRTVHRYDTRGRRQANRRQRQQKRSILSWNSWTYVSDGFIRSPFMWKLAFFWIF